MNLKQKREQNPNRAALQTTGLYHSFLLSNGKIVQGAMNYDFQLERLASFSIPSNLAGRSVLDIGPWDGFYSFEMEKRGARVTAIDYVDLDTFRCLHEYFGSKVDYRKLDVYELTAESVGTFDIVLCLGVLYHLKYPIEGLERICAITTDYCIIDTFVADATDINPDQLCITEFYERNELAGQLDNWWGPSIQTVMAWARTAGFASVQLLATTSNTATFKATRKWLDLPEPVDHAVRLMSINHHQNRGQSFSSTKEEYLEFWFHCEHSISITVDDIFPEVDGFGVPALAVHRTDNLFQASIRIPYGLSCGKHHARIRTVLNGWSEPLAFYLDPSSSNKAISVTSVQDGISWGTDFIDLSNGGWVTVWAEGLEPIADCGNTLIFVNQIPHYPTSVSPSTGQINFQIRPFIKEGRHLLSIEHLTAVSNSVEIVLKGKCSGVRGLEQLF